MHTNPENPSNESESNIQSGITRRSFIKRSSATVLLSLLALHSFRSEARADDNTASGNVEHPIQIDSLTDPIDDAVFFDDLEENGVIVSRKMRVTKTSIPEDLSKEKPAPSKTGTVNFSFILYKSFNQGISWIEENETVFDVTFTVSNPAFPNEGDITFSSTGVGQDGSGRVTTGVQILSYPNSEEDPRICNFSVKVLWLYTSCTWPNDSVIIHGAQNYTVYPGGELPGAMTFEHEELVILSTTEFAVGAFSEL